MRPYTGTTAAKSHVSLELVAEDEMSSIDGMMSSIDDGFADGIWQPYEKYVGWELDGNDRVYVQYKDEAGNVSEPYTGTVTFFSRPITITISYDDEGMDEAEEQSLELFVYDATAKHWHSAATHPSDYQHDLTSNLITVTLGHFRQFGLFQQEAAIQQRVVGVQPTFLPIVVH